MAAFRDADTLFATIDALEGGERIQLRAFGREVEGTVEVDEDGDFFIRGPLAGGGTYFLTNW